MRAPAKINLTLHIRGRRDDGLHELESLVAFAGFGDQLDFTPADRLALNMSGPTAELAGAEDDNLVMRAARALEARVPQLRTGLFHLVKRLPVAAGIGGGSADAAAALRLLALENCLVTDDPRLMQAARQVGADVPVCLDPRAKMMRGTGEILGPPLRLPPLFAVLVNPGVALPTKDVFAQIGLKKGEDYGFGTHAECAGLDFAALIHVLKKSRNDMEDAACVLAPVVGHVLNVLMAARGCRLARMSGSGATRFGLFETCRQAAGAAKIIRRDHPEWWVKASVLR